MPDTPHDDAFADLFAKLPDAPRRASTGRRSQGDADSAKDAAPASATEAAPPREEPAAERSSAPPPQVPMSRRAAREAAARAAAAQSAGESRESDVSAAPKPNTTDQAVVPSGAAGDAARQSPSTDPTSAWTDLTPASTDGTPAPTDSTPASATLDELFDDASHTEDAVAKPRRRRIGGWVALGVVLVLLGGIAGAGLWVWNTYEDQIREVMGWEEPKDYEEGLANGEALITISSGDTGSPISQKLFEAGVTKTPEAFYDYLIDTAQNPTFQPGVYRLQMQMTSAAALDAIMDPENKLENSALAREGLTVEQTLPLLAEGLGLPLEDFEAAVEDPSAYGVEEDSLEGWLFPAMYTFDPDVTAQDVIQTMVDRTRESLDNAGVPEADRQEILTIAAIIQREAREEDDFYRVSRVIQNRMDPAISDTDGLLQMDSTAQYGYGELHDGTVSSSGEALTDDNPWNTYVHTGLPIGPIANPGDLAIDAAMHPADGPWQYFVTVNLDTGETVFTETLAEHERAVAQWQAWCAANPDGGC